MGTRPRLLLVGLAFLLVACSAPCAQVNCAPSSLVVDNRSLPAEWLRTAQFTVCADASCRTLRGRVDGTLESVGVPLPVSDATPKRISLSVKIGNQTVLTATARKGFHVWTKQSRCPDCKLGKVFVAVDRNGHFSDWDGEF